MLSYGFIFPLMLVTRLVEVFLSCSGKRRGKRKKKNQRRKRRRKRSQETKTRVSCLFVCFIRLSIKGKLIIM